MEQELRVKVRERDEYLCWECRRDIRKPPIESLQDSVHHIVPKKHKGKDEENNLITLCKFCHRKIHGNKKLEKAYRNKIFDFVMKTQLN